MCRRAEKGAEELRKSIRSVVLAYTLLDLITFRGSALSPGLLALGIIVVGVEEQILPQTQ